MNNLELNDVRQHWDKFISAAIAWAPRIITAVISAFSIYLGTARIIRLFKRMTVRAFEPRIEVPFP